VLWSTRLGSGSDTDPETLDEISGGLRDTDIDPDTGNLREHLADVSAETKDLPRQV
jgi:hypothetical protein